MGQGNTIRDEAEAGRGTKAAGRWRVARFVVSFILLTALLLGGYHLLLGGPVMDRYIFEVARNTVWILDILGESCRFAGPDMLRGKEAEVRAALEAWPAGEDAEAVDAAEQPGEPLTPWEAWAYRAAERRWLMRRIGEYASRLADAPEAGAFKSYGQHRTFVDERIQLLEETLGVRSAPSTHTFAGIETRQAIQELRRRFEALPGEPSPENLTAQARELSELQAWAESLREIRIQELSDDLAQRQAMAGGWGPRIAFVWSSDAEAAPADSAGEAPEAKRFSFAIVPDCGALEAMAIFLAAVLVFPAAFVKKLAGIALGAPLLYAVNLGRLTCLAVIGALTPGTHWFDFSHKYVWQGIYVIFVVVFWLLWVEFIVMRKRD